MKRLGVFLLPLVASCSVGNSVHFDLRGFQTRSTETEYSTTFMREGTVVVTGDSRAARDPYIVVFEVKNISGGDPDLRAQQADPHYTVVLVNNGAGDFREYAGSRSKKTSYSEGESWEQEKVDVRPVGFVRLHKTK